MLFEAFFGVGHEFTIDVFRAWELSKRVTFHHMIDQTIFKHFCGKFAMSLVPCAVNFDVLFNLELEIVSIFVKEVPVFLRQADFLCNDFEFFR